MARIRSIKPELRTSITVSMWPREVRYFFVLMLGYFDDYGRGVDDELLIASDCFPRDRDITPERVDAWLELIADSGPLCRYEVDGRRYLHAPNWREHQKPSHPTRSKIPPCPDDEPDDFKKWREANPQRLRNRSRKSREGFAKIPEGAPDAPGSPSRGRSEDAYDASANGAVAHPMDATNGLANADKPAGQSRCDDAPEFLANSSGTSPDHFVPELGSKGARELGSKGAGGCGGSGAPEPSNAPAVVQTGRALPDRMLDAWWVKYGRGTAQSKRDIRRTIARALENGNDPDELWTALGRLGETSKPITAGTLTFAYSEIRKPMLPAAVGAENVIHLPTGHLLPGTDTRVAGWLALPTEE